MPVRRFAICDHCGGSLKRYEKLVNEETTGFDYEELKESGKPSFAEVDGWTVKASADSDDLDFEFYCRECSSLDGMFDSGDRVGV